MSASRGPNPSCVRRGRRTLAPKGGCGSILCHPGRLYSSASCLALLRLPHRVCTRAHCSGSGGPQLVRALLVDPPCARSHAPAAMVSHESSREGPCMRHGGRTAQRVPVADMDGPRARYTHQLHGTCPGGAPGSPCPHPLSGCPGCSHAGVVLVEGTVCTEVVPSCSSSAGGHVPCRAALAAACRTRSAGQGGDGDAGVVADGGLQTQLCGVVGSGQDCGTCVADRRSPQPLCSGGACRLHFVLRAATSAFGLVTP